MNIGFQKLGNVFSGQFSVYANSGLKSTDEKQQRKMQCENQVNFWKNKQESLKNRECNTLEEIAEKLELFHSYEEEINAAKMAYNNEQMWHVVDEAREQGEKIAEHAEKQKAKTPEERKEERKKEAQEAALGTEETDNASTEMLDEIDTDELVEELQEEIIEENQEELETELAAQQMNKSFDMRA